MYKIYGLLDPKTDEIRYIGVTTCKLSTRLAGHVYDGKHNTGTHKRYWIKTLLDNKLRPKIQLLEITTKENWEEREKYYIKTLSNLTNTHEGGVGIILDRKEDSIQRSAAAKYIPIVQLDLDGNFIKYWESGSVASTILNISRTSINNVLHYSSATAGGFRWVYKKDYDNNVHILKEIGVPSFSYTIIEESSGRIWKSIRQLSLELKVSHLSIKKYIDNGLPYKGSLYKIKI